MCRIKEVAQFLQDLHTLHSSYRCEAMLCSECIPDKGPYSDATYDYYRKRCPAWKEPVNPCTVLDTYPRACGAATARIRDDTYLRYFRCLLMVGETPASLCIRYSELVKEFLFFAICPAHKVKPNEDLHCECCVCKAFARVNQLLETSVLDVYSKEDILEAVKTLHNGKLAKALTKAETTADAINVLSRKGNKLDKLLRIACCDVTRNPCDYEGFVPGCYLRTGTPCRTCLAYNLLVSLWHSSSKEKLIQERGQ